MSNKKITVMAGTPVDTEMGCRLLKANFSCALDPIAVTDTPEKQTFFQTSDSAVRARIVKSLIASAISRGSELIFVYCNSLSATVDFEAISRDLHIKIITPFKAYQATAKQCKRVGLLTANAQGASGIEKELVQTNEKIKLYSISNLDWVNSIENKEDAKTICQNYGLPESVQFFETNKVEKIIFGCTHFPYFMKEYQTMTAIDCLSPDEYMLAEVVKALNLVKIKTKTL